MLLARAGLHVVGERACACGAPILTRRKAMIRCPQCANPEWPQSEVDALCDAMADGASYAEAAALIGRTKDAVVSRWRKLVRSMGAQAV